MSKSQERAAAEARRTKAQGLLDQFRGTAPGDKGPLTFADVITGAIEAGLTTGGKLRKDFGICHASLQKAKDGKPTDVPSEVRERFLRGLCTENGATYYQRGSKVALNK